MEKETTEPTPVAVEAEAEAEAQQPEAAPEAEAEEPQPEAAPEVKAEAPQPEAAPAVKAQEPQPEPATAEPLAAAEQERPRVAVERRPGDGDDRHAGDRAPRPADRDGPDGRPRRRGRGRRRPCVMCVDKMTSVDYKDFNFLRRFISDRGRIETRRKTGTCAKHQRALAQAIKRARYLALLPYTAEHFRMVVAPPR
jgi:small subunit ribosomal protein S18